LDLQSISVHTKMPQASSNNMHTLATKIESILFVAGKPIAISKLAEVTGTTKPAVAEAVQALAQKHLDNSGFKLLQHGQEVELVTTPGNTELVKEFLKKEELGELTRPQLEALAVIAYRGPIAKSELELIRGVNCSLILRNLQIRGLVEQLEDVVPTYQATADFLHFLGITKISDLPNYSELNSPEMLNEILKRPEPNVADNTTASK